MTVVPSRAREWWAGVGRHQRLQGSVLGAFAVAVILTSALLLSAGQLGQRLDSRASQSHGGLVLAQSMTRANLVLEAYDGSVQSRTDLADAAADLSAAIDGGNESEGAVWLPELRRLARSISGMAESSMAGETARTYAESLAQQQEVLLGELVADTQHLVADSSSDYSAWYRWVVVVAVIGMLVLALTVVHVILPLNRSIRRSLVKLEAWTATARQKAIQRKLFSEVTDGLESATSERQAFAVIERTLREITADFEVEVLLAESAKGNLHPEVVHPVNGGPGCGVTSPWSCPAVRAATSVVFDDSREIRACPHLARHVDPCSAACAPLMFMGEPMGVVHATGPVGVQPPENMVEALSVLATEASTRLGTLRAFAHAEMKAATDALTGSYSRRASEEKIGQLVRRPGSAAIALFEVGGLIDLNSHRGSQAGDHALRLFVETVRENVRATDWCGRWHGAQFLVVMEATTSADARRRLEATRIAVLNAFSSADLDGLTIRFGVTDSAGVTNVALLMEAADAALVGSGDDNASTLEELAAIVEQIEV